MRNLILMLVITFVLMLSTSCNNDNPTNNSGKTFPLLSGASLTKMSDVILSYLNDPNLVGVIEFESRKRNDYTINWYNGVIDYRPYDGIDNYADATFRDLSNAPFSVENLLINASLLREYAKGAYSKVGTDLLELNFGATANKYYIECLNNSLLPDSTYDQVTFSNRIELTNLVRNDTISKSQGRIISWIGGYLNEKVEVSVHGTNFEEHSSNFSPGFYNLVDNTGSYEITPLLLSNIGPTNRYFDIEITSYEPIVRTLSNGKKIILLGVSKNTTTIYLTD